MPASAAAPTYPTQAPRLACACAQRQARNTPVAPIRKLSATSFIRRNATRRCASASGSAPAKDSAKDARAARTGAAAVGESGLAPGGPDASPLTEARCDTTPSSILPVNWGDDTVHDVSPTPGQDKKPTPSRRKIKGV